MKIGRDYTVRKKNIGTILLFYLVLYTKYFYER